MSRIRLKNSDVIRLESTIKLFNLKIQRIKETRPDIMEIQPEILSSVNELKKLAQLSRKNFERTIKSYESYLKEGAELPYTTATGKTITSWEKGEIDRMYRSINARRNEMIRLYRPSEYQREALNLNVRKNVIEEILPKNWERYKQSLYRTYYGEQEKLYRENFIKAVQNELGEGELYNRLISISPEKLYRYLFTTRFINIPFIYEKELGQDVENLMLEELESL